MSTKLRSFQTLDHLFLLTLVILIFTGLVMVGSSSMEVSAERYGDPFYYLRAHLWRVLFALLIAGGVLFIPLSLWNRYRRELVSLGIVLLILTLGWGIEQNGSRRWLSLIYISVQAAEFVKLFFIIYMAGYLARHVDKMYLPWKDLAPPYILLSVTSLLLLLQPDFGAIVILSILLFSMLFLGQVNIYRLLLMILVSGFMAIFALLSDYRFERLLTFLDPWSDTYNKGYQLTNALTGIGRGDVMGTGLGNSLMKQDYLPEALTDFVFAIYAEEFGFLGVLFLLSCFVYLVWRIFCIGKESLRRGLLFNGYVAYGCGLLFAIHSLVHFAVNMGVLPTKGLPLPFISYGGSNLLLHYVLIALVLRSAIECGRQSSVRSPHTVLSPFGAK